MPPFIPRAVCAECNVAFKPSRNGIDLEAVVAQTGQSYYKVAADKWTCPRCHNSIYVGFGTPIERHDPRYDQVPTQSSFVL